MPTQVSSKLARLRDSRFPELPLDCGDRPDPGVLDTEEWRDWSEVETTPDQLRIEDYLDLFDLSGRSILHVGVGNSGLGLRFTDEAKLIFGTSVVDAEVERANSLGLENYRAIFHNKYSGDDQAVPARVDFIVDNNPTAFCCCMTHLAAMLDFYAGRLEAGGQVVTDRVGLAWTTNAPGGNARWSFTFDDLASVAALAGLTAERAGPTIYTLSRGSPRRPSAIARSRYWLHWAWQRAASRLKRFAAPTHSER